jgi:hypothetical protein
MPSRSTYINHHARTSRLRLVAVKTIFFHILIPLPRLTGKRLLFEYAEWYTIFIMPGGLRMMSISFLQLFVGICQLVFRWVSLLKKRSAVT